MPPDLTPRRCYICGRGDNPVVASEAIEYRYGKPVMPEDQYRFARCAGCGTLYVDSDVTDAYLASVYEGESLDEDAPDFQVSPEDIRRLRVPEFQRHWQLLEQIAPAPARRPRCSTSAARWAISAPSRRPPASSRAGSKCRGVRKSKPAGTDRGPAAIVHHGTFDTAEFGRRFE